MQVRFVVPRYEDGGITDTAIVTADVLEKELQDISIFKNALITTIDEWVELTKSGQKAMQDSNWDFNVGDLALAQEDLELQGLLNKNGIYGLTVEITLLNSYTDWHFDTHLFTKLPGGRRRGG
jgi:hypothetical protein